VRNKFTSPVSQYFAFSSHRICYNIENLIIIALHCMNS